MVTVCNLNSNADISQKVKVQFKLPATVELNSAPDIEKICDMELSPDNTQRVEFILPANVEVNSANDLVTVCNMEHSNENSQRVEIEFVLPVNVENLTPETIPDIETSAANLQKANTRIYMEEQNDFDSAVAPMYSPLTPLVNKQKSTTTVLNLIERKSSLLPRMTPITIEAYQALSDVSLYKSKEKEIETAQILDIAANEIENVRNDDFSYLDTSQGRPKRGRKRKNVDYTLRERKFRKYSNLSYQGKTKFVNATVFLDYRCSCKIKCHQLISKELREKEFQNYIRLGFYEAQLLFIVNSVKESPKRRTYTVVNGNKTGKTQPKQFKRTYTLANIEVCQDMFINNFQISPKKVDISLKKVRNGQGIKDKRGQVVGGWNKTREEDIQFVKNVIDLLPKYVSHYRREENNDCLYLKLGMTIQKIYELYLEKFREVYGDLRTPVSFSTLKNIFYTNYNLRCKTLKKDTCSRCDAFNNQIKNSTGKEQEQLQEERMKHLKRAEDLRDKMKKDLLRAKIDDTFECITFDLEKTIPLPRIPTSIVFYKRQLWLYNCGIHVGSDDSAHCYIWIEGEAGRGAQEVGSCLIKFIIEKLNPKVENLVLWSDCCGGQNRNIKIVLMLKIILSTHETLKTITLKYLESGHTFLPNDTDFSKIETQLKYHERIYTAEEYISVIKNSEKKNPIQVQRMKKEYFLSTKKLEKCIVNRKIFMSKEKVNWLKTKEILLKKDYIYIVFMKSADEDIYQELNLEKKIRGKTLQINENFLTLLWPNGKEIPQAKLDDLKSLFEYIPKDCLEFYKSLRGNASFQDDIDGFGIVPDFDIESEIQIEEDI